MARLARRNLAVVAVALAATGGAASAEPGGVVRGTVTVKLPAGAPVEPVVVYLVGFTEPPPARPVTVMQRKQAFIPSLVAITAGQSVSFPNGDPFLHNVFSATPLRRFDLGSYPEGETRDRQFPKAGVVNVFCNIHPEMSATILVLPNRRFARADGHGRFEIRDVPPGSWTIYAYSRRARAPAEAPAVVTAGGETVVDLALEEQTALPRHRNKYGETYRDPARYR